MFVRKLIGFYSCGSRLGLSNRRKWTSRRPFTLMRKIGWKRRRKRLIRPRSCHGIGEHGELWLAEGGWICSVWSKNSKWVMGRFRTGSNIVGVEKEIEAYLIASDGEFESRGVQWGKNQEPKVNIGLFCFLWHFVYGITTHVLKNALFLKFCVSPHSFWFCLH